MVGALPLRLLLLSLLHCPALAGSCGGARVVELVSAAGELRLERRLRVLHAREVELVLRAAGQIELLTISLDASKKENRPRREKNDDYGYRNAARDDHFVLLRTLFESMYCLLHDHTALRREHDNIVFFADQIPRLDRELLNRLYILTRLFQKLLQRFVII